MENSAYVPSSGHLNSPALVVFSQAAGGLQDALRIQRPFNPQFAMSEASKELHRPFTSSFGLRHMEAYSGLPAHILNHLQPQFLHPGLSLGSGAFRPLADLKAFPSPSAFAPPKCLKIETNSESVHHGHGIFSPSEERFLGPSPRTDSCSPASASMSPQPQTTVKEESLDAHMSEDGDGAHGQATDNDSPGIHEDNRGFRIGPLFGGGFSGSGAYTFSVPGLPPAAHALAKTSFLFDNALTIDLDAPDEETNTPAPGENISTPALHPRVEEAAPSRLVDLVDEVNANPAQPNVVQRPPVPAYRPPDMPDLVPLSDLSMRERGLLASRIRRQQELLFHRIMALHPGFRQNPNFLLYHLWANRLPVGSRVPQIIRPEGPNLPRAANWRPEFNVVPRQALPTRGRAARGRGIRGRRVRGRPYSLQRQILENQRRQNDLRGLDGEGTINNPSNPHFSMQQQIHMAQGAEFLQMSHVVRQPRVQHQSDSLQPLDLSMRRNVPQPEIIPQIPNLVQTETNVERLGNFIRIHQINYQEQQSIILQPRSNVFQPSGPVFRAPLPLTPIIPVRIKLVPNVNPPRGETPRMPPTGGIQQLPFNPIPNVYHQEQNYRSMAQLPPSVLEQFPSNLIRGDCSLQVQIPQCDVLQQRRSTVHSLQEENLIPSQTHSEILQHPVNDTLIQSLSTLEQIQPQPPSAQPGNPSRNVIADTGWQYFWAHQMETSQRSVPLPPFETIANRGTPRPTFGPGPSQEPAINIALNKKKRDPSCCPICGMTISPGDLEAHLGQELEVLCKINGTGLAATRKRRQEPGRPPALPGDSGPEGRWETFQRIKSNRQGRLRMKTRKRKLDDGCMICVGRIHRTPEEMNMHVEQCRKNSVNDEDETVDVEGDSELEEWADNQRRTSNSNANTGNANIGSSTGRMISEADNEGDDVIVDGDEPEESSFGPSQYSQSDVVIKNSEKNKKDGVQSQVATVNSSGDVEVTMDIIVESDSNVSTSDAEPSSRTQMLEELRNRIRPLNTENTGETATSTETEDYKCLICLEHYKKPVISTVCWHVHCEDCWLHALGSKNICPQCSMITTPTDLRRIFM